jgi:hypothetical protein
MGADDIEFNQTVDQKPTDRSPSSGSAQFVISCMTMWLFVVRGGAFFEN